MLPPRQDARDGLAEKALGFIEAAWDKIESVYKEKAELWLLCESRLIPGDPLHTGANKDHRCCCLVSELWC